MFPCMMSLNGLVDYVEGRLPAVLRPAVEAHLQDCPACYKWVKTAPLEHYLTWYDDIVRDDPPDWEERMARGQARTEESVRRKGRRRDRRCRLRARLRVLLTGREDPWLRDPEAYYAAARERYRREEEERTRTSADGLCRLLRWHQANIARALPAPEEHLTDDWQRLRAAIDLLDQARATIIAHYALPADAGADPYLRWHLGSPPQLEREPPPWSGPVPVEDANDWPRR